MDRLLIVWLLVFQPLLLSQPQRVYCAPNGICIDSRFDDYWKQNGKVDVFGYPITDIRKEQNSSGQEYWTQWFERNRLEYHPENAKPFKILLGRLGDDYLRQTIGNWQTLPKGNPKAPHYYVETGHAIDDKFWAYWSEHGLDLGHPDVSDEESLALFGYPLSEAKMEKNSSGDTVLTQWFERARFEYHPKNEEKYKVLLGLLGNDIRARNPLQPAPTTQPVSTAPAPPSSTPQNGATEVVKQPTQAATQTKPPVSSSQTPVVPPTKNTAVVSPQPTQATATANNPPSPSPVPPSPTTRPTWTPNPTNAPMPSHTAFPDPIALPTPALPTHTPLPPPVPPTRTSLPQRRG